MKRSSIPIGALALLFYMAMLPYTTDSTIVLFVPGWLMLFARFYVALVVLGAIRVLVDSSHK